MEDDHLAVGSEPDIAFNGKPACNGCLGGRKSVLDAAGLPVVKAAMGDGTRGEPGGPGQERAQAISAIASTSTATPRGRLPMPMADRACLPRWSPSTSVMRSDAPLMTLWAS